MAAAAPLVVPALTRHTATVIMAHGLGDRFVLQFLQPSKGLVTCLQKLEDVREFGGEMNKSEISDFQFCPFVDI